MNSSEDKQVNQNPLNSKNKQAEKSIVFPPKLDSQGNKQDNSKSPYSGGIDASNTNKVFRIMSINMGSEEQEKDDSSSYKASSDEEP